LEHLNKLVIEPIDDILILSMFEDLHIGHLALMMETLSLWFTCNCWNMSLWIQEEFSLFPRESSWIGHACAYYSWDDRLLPPSSWISYMHTKPLTDLFKKEKKSKKYTIFSHVLPIRTHLCFIAISSCWCICLWAIAILLIFLELYTVVHILRIQQPYLPGIC
jgi:hypothetical protein